MKTAREIVDEQADDEALWFRAQRITEAYLQQALRRLHEAVERDGSDRVDTNHEGITK